MNPYLRIPLTVSLMSNLADPYCTVPGGAAGRRMRMVALCSRHHLHTGLRPALVCKTAVSWFPIPNGQSTHSQASGRYGHQDLEIFPILADTGCISAHLPPHIDPTDAPAEGAAVLTNASPGSL